MSQTPNPSALAASCDVLVIGGGPAGSTAAALLARQGRDVLLVEKAQHPRFHIGESLLPANARLFDALGVRDQVDAIGLRKFGVEFNSPQHSQRSLVAFSDAWDRSLPYAWQVRRSEFDALLFRHAESCGARTLQSCQVRQVQFDPDGATAVGTQADGQPQQWRARFVLDASGRDTLLARQFGAKRKNQQHDSAALFAHFDGAERLPGAEEGHISIFWFAHGWFWFIPLRDGSTSVGAVCWPQYLKSRSKPLQEFFLDTLAQSQQLQQRLRHARLRPETLQATGNYSYGADHACGDRYALLGDAYAFIDPVFSSGVYLAMTSAFAATELVAARLDQPRRAAAARRRFTAHMRRGPREFSWFIYRMTNPTIRDMFMHPRNLLGAKPALTSLLAGDIYGAAPIGPGLRVFKSAYALLSLLEAGRTWRAWLSRRQRLREAARATDATDAAGSAEARLS
jgi:flavin-dependent dehydrogenase